MSVTPRGIAVVLCLPLLLCLGLASAPGATAPETKRKTVAGPEQEQVEIAIKKEFIHALSYFDGTQYLRTFCPEEIDTIYLMADTVNAITDRRAGVYFWPSTREYMGDWTEWNEEQQGELEILQGNRVIRRLRLVEYTLAYPEGYQGKATRLLVGDEAHKAIEAQEVKTKVYNESLARYYERYRQYSALLERFLTNPKTIEEQPPVEPRQPEPPKIYVPPIEKGFMVNLPSGSYRIRLRNGKGQLLPESEKRLVVFAAIARGIAYQIIPEDRWTYPTKSDSREEAIFGRRGQVAYLKPFVALQFNKHHYLRMAQLRTPSAGRGMENQSIWVHVAPWTGGEAALALTRGKRVLDRIREKPYFVKQNPGYVLGYKVVEYSAKEFPAQEPSFTAYRVAMPADFGPNGLRLISGDGRVVEGGNRDLRTIRRVGSIWLVTVAFLPLLLGLVVWKTRALRTRDKA